MMSSWVVGKCECFLKLFSEVVWSILYFHYEIERIISWSPKAHNPSTTNHFSVRSFASASEIYSRRSCKEGKKWIYKMSCEAIKKSYSCVGLYRERHEEQRKLQSGMIHWPRLTPLRLCRAPCRLQPLSLLNPGPPSTSAVSICILPHWNKDMRHKGVMCCYCNMIFE